MSLLDRIKSAFTGSDAATKEFEQVILDTWKEYAANHDSFWGISLNETTIWRNEVKGWPHKKKIQFILWLVSSIHHFKNDRDSWKLANKEQQLHSIREAYLQALFLNTLLMDDEDARQLHDAFSKHKIGDWGTIAGWPVARMLHQLEKQRKGQPTGPVLRQMLEVLKKDISAVQAIHPFQDKWCIKMLDIIDAILFDKDPAGTAVKAVRFMGDDDLAKLANPAIEQMPEAERLLWYKLLQLAQKATGSKPSRKYSEDTKAIINELGADAFKKTIREWLLFLINLKEQEQQHSVSYSNGHSFDYTSYDYLTSVNVEAVKGLVWACANFCDHIIIQTIAALAERTFRKIPGKGPTAASLGNACLYVLYQSKSMEGIAQLSRLKLRIRQVSTQSIIDKYLLAAATEQGVTVAEVEDMAVDSCGLVNGSLEVLFDGYKAILEITGVGKTEIKWFKPDGSPQKSIPAAVKEQYAEKLKELKQIVKQAEQTLVAQRDRIDRMLRSDRRLTPENFAKYYLNHGLMAYLANGIIWNFHESGHIVQAIRLNGQWVNAENELVNVTGAEAVSLWHPVQATVAEIQAWRGFLIFHRLQQPLKQAFREVYLLTDAEVNTKSYSNRMAAHILRQHQFNSLAKARGWRYALMGAFDNGMDSDKAMLALPEHNLRAEYWIGEIAADGAMNDTGIWNYVSTDQVRFVNTATDATVDLIDIPPIVFSEVMRDVDLFVGVASVGNDPTWNDSGGLPVYRDYWTSFSFGELSEVAKNRKEILTSLVPRLKISSVATIKDKFLIVKGKLRTYKIHIGSTNILMEPNDQYLCIVQDRSQKIHTENLFLPFEGDSGLSVILSKAFLLADDDKITDTTITSQINRK